MTPWWQQTLDYWRAGGLLLAPIALVSWGIWLYFLRMRAHLLYTLRNGHALETALSSGEPVGRPEDLARGLLSFRGCIAGVLRKAMADVRQGDRPLDAFNARETECMIRLRRDLVVLAAFTAIAPLLGLLGTVIGMIETFGAVSAAGGDTGSRVAAGISRALITTQFGLVVALPGVFGLSRLQRMLRNTRALMGACRALVVERLEQGSPP